MDQFILDAVAWGGYFAIALLMVVENIFPPIPSEVILGLGGVLVARGELDFWPLLAIATIGSTAGNYAWFWLGDKWGFERLHPIVDRYGRWLTMEWEDVEEASRFFQRHGRWAVFIARFMPVFRTMISLPAGLAHMGRGQFLTYTFCGAAIWNTILIFGGTVLHGVLGETQNILSGIVFGTIGLTVVYYIWRVIRWKPRSER